MNKLTHSIALYLGGFLLSSTLTAGHVWAYSMPAGGGEIGTSATMIGRGSIEGFSDGASGVFENSATLMYNRLGYSASTMWAQFPNTDASYLNVSGIFSVDPSYALGIGMIKASIANIDITQLNEDGEVVSSELYSAGSTILAFGGRYTLSPTTQLGLTLRSTSSSLSPTMSGSSIEFDPGIFLTQEYGYFSISAHNILGGAITYPDGSKDNTSQEWVVSYRSFPLTEYNICVFGQIRQRQEFQPKAIGVSFPMTTDSLILSFGWREDLVVKTLRSRLSLGVSLILDHFSINYALEPSDYFQQAGQHYVSIEYK